MSEDLAGLAAKLLFTIHTMLGAPVPSEPPPISFMPRERMTAFCSNGCRVNGYYDSVRGVVLSADLDPLEDLEARATLIHELVHYVQYRMGRQGGQTGCLLWVERESEAYAVENRWRERYRMRPNTSLEAVLRTFSFAECLDREPVQTDRER